MHAFGKGYQGYKSNFGFRVPFDHEIRQIWDQKSIFAWIRRKERTLLGSLLGSLRSDGDGNGLD